MEALVVLSFLAVSGFFMWLFYLWGATIAEGKGRSRSLGWWSAFFGIPAIIVLALLSSETQTYIPHAPSSPRSSEGLADQLEQLGNLREKGALTEEEFEERKRALLGGT